MLITDPVFEKLTEEELKLYKEYKTKSSGMHNAGLLYEYPDKVRYCTELFPGNYLDEKILAKIEELKLICADFRSLVYDTNTGEREILNFIRDRKAYHLIGSIQKKNYNFGHHGTFIFPELQLGTTHQVDYLMLGRNSDGFYFVFVELESPYGNITIGDGDEGEVIRKGLNQVDDWDRWLEEHYGSVSETLGKYRHQDYNLPEEFYKLDKTRIKYGVAIGSDLPGC
jgi:hypothetical protein